MALSGIVREKIYNKFTGSSNARVHLESLIDLKDIGDTLDKIYRMMEADRKDIGDTLDKIYRMMEADRKPNMAGSAEGSPQEDDVVTAVGEVDRLLDTFGKMLVRNNERLLKTLADRWNPRTDLLMQNRSLLDSELGSAKVLQYIPDENNMDYLRGFMAGVRAMVDATSKREA